MLLYMQDSYLKEFEATVQSVDGDKIFLDKTAFYPKGGGLPNDTGVLIKIDKEYPVTFVGKEGGKVFHQVENGLEVGDIVKGRIDWDRRYKLMRMHTATHILSAIFYKDAGTLITGNSVDVDRSRVDFSLEQMDREFIDKSIRKANEKIAKGREVKVYFLPREEAFKIPGIVKLAGKLPPSVKELRVVEIEGIDIQADGGPHVKNTNEIGEIVFLKAVNKGKNNRRMYFELK